MPTTTIDIDGTTDLDIERLIEEAEHGVLSIPWADLPPFVRGLLTPAIEERQRRDTSEQQEIVRHRHELIHDPSVKDGRHDRTPEYQQAFEECFAAIDNAKDQLNKAMSGLNDSEKLVGDRLADVERHAIRLPNGQLAFYENGQFVYENGGKVGAEYIA